jgi:triacylglycerol lipase
MDTSWEALFNPGAATDFFVSPLPRFEIEATGYSPANAWWFAEISRLIYKQDAEKRAQLFTAAGLREVKFVDHPLAQCAIVKARDDSFTVLVFRGSHNLADWLTNLQTAPGVWPPHPGHVHQGFRDALESVIEEVDGGLKDVTGRLYYTGHSLGAALATLSAAHKPPQAVYAFGSPRVGNQEFLATLGRTKMYRVVNSRDLVATAPPANLGFDHCEELRYISRDGQVFLNPTNEHTDPYRPFFLHPNWHKLVSPPEEMADHAPINYVTRLRAAIP